MVLVKNLENDKNAEECHRDNAAIVSSHWPIEYICQNGHRTRGRNCGKSGDVLEWWVSVWGAGHMWSLGETTAKCDALIGNGKGCVILQYSRPFAMQFLGPMHRGQCGAHQHRWWQSSNYVGCVQGGLPMDRVHARATTGGWYSVEVRASVARGWCGGQAGNGSALWVRWDRTELPKIVDEGEEWAK